MHTLQTLVSFLMGVVDCFLWMGIPAVELPLLGCFSVHISVVEELLLLCMH